MAKLTYDPFPDAKMEDVVRREIIGRKLILYVKLKTDDIIHPSIPIPYNGHDFYLTRSEQDMKTNIVEFRGSAFLTEIQPMKILAKLREKCASLNPKN